MKLLSPKLNRQKQRKNKQSGFTLIELIVALAIAGILISYAIPAYHDFSLRQALSNQTNNLIGDLNYARTLAVDKGSIIRVRTNDNSANWEQGWRIIRIIPAAPNEVIRITAALPGTITLTETAGLSAVNFNNFGALAIGSDPIAINIQDAPEYPNYITLSVSASGLTSSNRKL